MSKRTSTEAKLPTRKNTKKKSKSIEPEKSDEKAIYEVNEICLAFHGPLVYEAKILRKIKDHKDRDAYLIHYQGWGKKYDEWVAPDRILKKTPVNVTFMKELVASQKKKKSDKKNGKKAKAQSSAQLQVTATSKKLLLEEVAESKADLQARKDIPLKIPLKLEERLVRDYIRISEECLLPLPREQTVNSILDEYLAIKLQELIEKENKLNKKNKSKKKGSKSSKKKKKAVPTPVVNPTPEDSIQSGQADSTSAEASAQPRTDNLPGEAAPANNLPAPVVVPAVPLTVEQQVRLGPSYQSLEEMCSALKQYFIHSLSSSLLYFMEQVQYQDLETELCDTYGCEHLLRLFVKLPLFLANTTIQPKARALFLANIHDFLKWFEWQGEMFSGDYVEISAAYRKRACSAHLEEF